MGGRSSISSCCSENMQISCDKTICDKGGHADGGNTYRSNASSEGIFPVDEVLPRHGASFGLHVPPTLSAATSVEQGSASARSSTSRRGVSFMECEPDGVPYGVPVSIGFDCSEKSFFDACFLAPPCNSMFEDRLGKPVVSKSDVAISTNTEERRMTWSEKIDDVLNNSLGWSIFVCVLTVWALFADDVRVLCLPKSIDLTFLIVTLCILAIFLAEFFLCALVQDGYACSLGALMDLLAAVSLVPFDEILREIDGVGNSISVARVARAARALRILRATRAAVMALKTEARVRRMRRMIQNKQVSVLADTLIQSTNIKVLLGILVLLIGTSLLSIDQSDRVTEGGLELLDLIYEQDYLASPGTGNTSSAWSSLRHDYRRAVEGVNGDSLRRLVRLQIWGITYLSLPTEDVRNRDLFEFVSGDRISELRSLAIVSEEELSKAQAVNSLIMTCFCVVVIILWGWSFRRDHRKLVIGPVKRMIKLLRDMTSDPRRAMDSAQSCLSGQETTEIEIVEKCLSKFGGLLKVGFGEAGMNIIAQNMKQANFDPVAPGVLVKAIFGFCDIRNFTDCCEVLNEDTLIFTNRIAHIVHGVVENSGGTVNKNIGDAFLSVWKLQETEHEGESDEPLASNNGSSLRTSSATTNSGSSLRTSLTTGPRKRNLSHHLTGNLDTCDAAMYAFLKMNELMKSSEAIQELSLDPRLQKKLPGYRVRLGSGLHLGWAVEGAVGTSHKVDATYLSPHVNMAARLEAATKQYGVSILMSEALVHEFGEKLRGECRPVDRVTVKGSAQPMILYVHMPSESADLSESQRHEFMLLWGEAFELYRSGSDWGKAAELVGKCMGLFPSDKPSKVLLDVIERAGGKAPRKWNGYRELTEK